MSEEKVRNGELQIQQLQTTLNQQKVQIESVRPFSRMFLVIALSCLFQSKKEAQEALSMSLAKDSSVDELNHTIAQLNDSLKSRYLPSRLRSRSFIQGPRS